jgi:hypothetical protein
MFYQVADAGELPPDELRGRYDDQLRAVLDAHGVDRVVERSGVDREWIDALAAGESPTLTLEEGAEILALADDEPDAEAIVLETRDHLLMGMSVGVLDVETVASGIDDAIDPKEIQAKIEGRLRITMGELARLQSYIDGRSP